MSAEDIGKGARWSALLAGELAQAKIGILCLTRDNLAAPWMLFEAGALSKTLERTFVCPYLLGLRPADLGGPLVRSRPRRRTGPTPGGWSRRSTPPWAPPPSPSAASIAPSPPGGRSSRSASPPSPGPANPPALRPARSERDLLERCSRWSASWLAKPRHTRGSRSDAAVARDPARLPEGPRGGLEGWIEPEDALVALADRWRRRGSSGRGGPCVARRGGKARKRAG